MSEDERMPPPGDAAASPDDRTPSAPPLVGSAEGAQDPRQIATEPVEPVEPVQELRIREDGLGPDVSPAQEASPLPGAHRGGFRRLPTAPVDVTVQSAPAEPGTEDTPLSAQWAPAEASVFHRGLLSGWALTFAIVGLVVALFVGWGFPIGIVAIVSAVIALRRPLESRAVAMWALVLGSVSILYSAGWLLFAVSRAKGHA